MKKGRSRPVISFEGLGYFSSTSLAADIAIKPAKLKRLQYMGKVGTLHKTNCQRLLFFASGYLDLEGINALPLGSIIVCWWDIILFQSDLD